MKNRSQNANKKHDRECKASAFKELRSMEDEKAVEILKRCLKNDIDVWGIKKEDKAIKDKHEVQRILLWGLVNW